MSMPKTKRSAAGAQDKGERTREHILKSALALFRRRGFDKATMRDVAASAEVALGAAYYYFPSKEALVLAYYRDTQVAHSARARERMASATTVEERVAAVMHAKLDVLQKDRKLLGTIFKSIGDQSDPLSVFGETTRDVRRESAQLFEEALADAPFPAELRPMIVQALWALHMGVVLYFMYDASTGQIRTRRLVDRAVGDATKLATFAPVIAPILAPVKATLEEAGLLDAGDSPPVS